MKRFIKKIFVILDYIATAILPLLITIIPKNKKIWLFSCWAGKSFSDNSKAMYEYTHRKNDIRAIWISKNKKISKELVELGFESYYYLEMKGIYYQLVAGVVFLTHNIGSDYCRFLIAKNVLRVNLWHGMPLKKIRFNDFKTYTRLNIKIKSSRLYQFISNERYDYILSLGKVSTDILSSALGHGKKCFLEFGFPRNDVLINEQHTNNESPLYFVYLPTFRGEIGSELDLIDVSNIDLNQVDEFLNKTSSFLYIKNHPANKISLKNRRLIDGLNRVIISDEDTYELLINSSGMITDYSSVMFDYSLTNKPISFFTFDYEEYVNGDRDFYFEIENLSSGLQSEDFIKCIRMLCEEKKQELNSPLSSMHCYERGRSTELLYNFILSKVSEGEEI